MRLPGRLLGSLVSLSLGSCAPAAFALAGHDLGPATGARVGQPLVFSFNDDVDPGSVRGAALRVVGERDGAEVQGSLEAQGATLLFRPRLPLAADLKDGGLHPGERYRVELPGLPKLRVLRGLTRGALAEGASFEFTAIELFVDPVPGPPALLDDARHAPRLKEGKARLAFNEPLVPRAVARAHFWLLGPWSRTLRASENPPMTARLVENQVAAPGMPGAVIELTLAAAPPAPLVPVESYEILLEPEGLCDFGGHALQNRGAGPEQHVALILER